MDEDPLWWIQPKIEETEEKCEARLRKISEDLKAYYHAKKNPPPRVFRHSLDDLIDREMEMMRIFKDLLMTRPMPVMKLDSIPLSRKPRETVIIKDDLIEPEIPQKKRGFYEHLQHPRNPKHRF